jgi:hypothetical protein
MTLFAKRLIRDGVGRYGYCTAQGMHFYADEDFKDGFGGGPLKDGAIADCGHIYRMATFWQLVFRTYKREDYCSKCRIQYGEKACQHPTPTTGYR